MRSFSQAPVGDRVQVSLLGFVVAGAVLAGCQNLPETQPSKGAVFKAAKEVISERYPMSAASEGNGFLNAITPVAMDGATKTYKVITVWVKQNGIGAYEPVVTVHQFADTRSPDVAPTHRSQLFVEVPAIVAPEWQLLDGLPYEEVEISQAILQRIAPKGM